jgi:hypothetical protein
MARGSWNGCRTYLMRYKGQPGGGVEGLSIGAAEEKVPAVAP